MAAKSGRTNIPRAKTVQLKQVECMITEFRCHDEGVVASVSGVHKMEWKVLVGDPNVDEQALDIELCVDKAVITSQKVKLQDKGYDKGTPKDKWHIIFPQQLEKQHAGAALPEDLVYEWKFRGSAQVCKPGPSLISALYEVKQADSDNIWWPAWLENETHEGKFMATLRVPKDERKRAQTTLEQFYQEAECMQCIDMPMPGFGRQNYNGEYTDIRFRETKKPLKILRKTLRIEVPFKDPLHNASLKIFSGTEDVEGVATTKLYGRPSPAPVNEGSSFKPAPAKHAKIVIDKDRKKASVEGWTQQEFQRCVDNKVTYTKSPVVSRYKKEWYFAVGNNQHVATLERKAQMGGIHKSAYVTLHVDGQLLVDSKPEDLWLLEGTPAAEAKQHAKTFNVEFDLKGKLECDFLIYKVNRDGNPITHVNGHAIEPTLVPRIYRFATKVEVHVDDIDDIANTASIVFKQGKQFTEIMEWMDLDAFIPEDTTTQMECEPKMLESYYCKNIPGFQVPWAVDETADYGMQKLGKDIFGQGQSAASKLQASFATDPEAGQGGILDTIRGWLACMCSPPQADASQPASQ